MEPSGFAAARVAERIERMAPSVGREAPEFMAAVLEVVAAQVLAGSVLTSVGPDGLV